MASLFLLYGGFVSMEAIDPLLAASSITVLVGMVLMKILFIKASRSSRVDAAQAQL